MRILTVFAAFLLATGVAHAKSKSGVTVPDTVEVEGKTLQLNGLGTREATMFNVDVYVGALYLETKSSDANQILQSQQIKRLDLNFVRDVDRDDITDAWNDGFKKNGADVAKLKPRIDKLNGWMAEMKKKDVLSFTYVPEKGLTVSVKGQVKGTIEGADFGQAFLAIWLGPKPPNGGLKKGLLGK
jgi:hypothetical protein